MSDKTFTQQMTETCRHFTGLHRTHCSAAIEYKSLDRKKFRDLPCIFHDYKHKCKKWAVRTTEDIEEIERSIRDSLEAMASFQNRKTDQCIVCGQPITAMEQVRRCVYAKPCGCRLWQGAIPDAWKDSTPTPNNNNVRCFCCNTTFNHPDPDGTASIQCPSCGRIT